MLLLFPFLAWLAAATSAALLVMLYAAGELEGRGFGILSLWFVVAAYCQFLGATAVIATSGLVLQTVLAICLVIRWKVTRL